MKRFAGLSLGVALSVAALMPGGAQAASFGGVSASGDFGALPLVRVQSGPPPSVGGGAIVAGPRVRGPVAAPRGRGGYGYHGRRRGGGVAAGAVLGAAILGGAIIANSQRNRGYYYDDDGYYYAPAPAYGGGYYYGAPAVVPAPADNDADVYYYGAPGYYYGAPGDYGRPAYRGYPHNRVRGMRDPAGGGSLK